MVRKLNLIKSFFSACNDDDEDNNRLWKFTCQCDVMKVLQNITPMKVQFNDIDCA